MPGYFGTPQEFAERPGATWCLPEAVIYYDPTNGSKSLGNIYYYGPGGGINPSPQPGREDCWQEELHP